MNAAQIRNLGPELRRFLAHFEDCFPRSDTRAHLPTYVRGLLSDLPRKSVEPIALAQDIPPRSLQQFLSLLSWDQALLRDRTQKLVAAEHASAHSVGIIDDTACAKKGDKTPGVQRQYCNATGKVDNCVVTVHLGYAADSCHCLLDSELYLPRCWDEDRERCRAAGIPDELTCRPKWRIALELFDRARANGVQFAWLTFDEGYGEVPTFLHELHRRQQAFVAEVPANFRGWLRLPRLRRTPRGRLRAAWKASRVDDLARYSPTLRDQEWVAWHVKDGEKGPEVWEVKHARFHPQTAEKDPALPWHLLVARCATQPEVVKYFVSNAPAETPVATLLLVAFSRWHEERCFEDEKTELGFDHYEGRNYTGLIRHQRLVALAHLFCSRLKERLRGEKPGGDSVPGAQCGSSISPVVVVEQAGSPTAVGADSAALAVQPAEQCQGAGQPHQADLRQAA
jgi:SRSO17 transposase